MGVGGQGDHCPTSHSSAHHRQTPGPNRIWWRPGGRAASSRVAHRLHPGHVSAARRPPHSPINFPGPWSGSLLDPFLNSITACQSPASIPPVPFKGVFSPHRLYTSIQNTLLPPTTSSSTPSTAHHASSRVVLKAYTTHIKYY